ncbi:MAG: SMC-Scp complex subunit ScpB [Gammaproteobacteria bacterium]|nr:SMC-Scp complex subunit ScpB [Gammaproteobacteria bacterium]
MAELIDREQLRAIVDGALLAAGEPLSVDRLVKIFAHGELDSEEGRAQIRECLKELEAMAEGRGYQLKRVASGYRYQVRQEVSGWVSRLWDEKPPRYSRALLETLALVAYKQPVTRGDIEQVRGVSVSQNIMRTMLERGWIRVVGQREVPGRPSMYGTTRAFLDYFNLKSLDQLPPLSEIRALIEPVLVEEEAAAAPEALSDQNADQDPDRNVEQLHPDLAAGDLELSVELEVQPAADASDEETAEQRVSADVVPLPTTPH